MEELEVELSDARRRAQEEAALRAERAREEQERRAEQERQEAIEAKARESVEQVEKQIAYGQYLLDRKRLMEAGLWLTRFMPDGWLIAAALERLPKADPDLELAIMDRPIHNAACNQPHLRVLLPRPGDEERAAWVMDLASRLVTHLQKGAEAPQESRYYPEPPAAPTPEEQREWQRKHDRAMRPAGGSEITIGPYPGV